MIIYNMLQGSDEWHEVRHGKLTGSHATAIGNNGKGLDTYIESIIENLCTDTVFITNKDTERGNELEPFARLKYEFETGNQVQEVGFVEHTKYCGVSPDGLIKGKKKGLEIKARNYKKHMALLRFGKVDSNTIWQMNMCMLVTGFDSWDFVSYNKDFKQSFYLKTFERDEKRIEKLKAGIESGTAKLKEAFSDPIVIKEMEWYNSNKSK